MENTRNDDHSRDTEAGPTTEKVSAPTNKEFWLGLEDYSQDPEFQKLAENEFQSSPLSGDKNEGWARREFLKLMGASFAMATAACVRRPVQTIIPYVNRPKEIIPGIPNHYTSAWFDGNEGMGLLVKTRDGRPIKMEGNPLHPLNRGALSARAQAQVLALYDPDRLKGPQRNLQNERRSNREPISANWEQLDARVVEQLGKGDVAVLTSNYPSPTGRALVNDFLGTYRGRLVTYDDKGVSDVIEAQRRSYGRATLPRYRFDRAQAIVSIDCDFLGTYLSPVEFMRQWSTQRRPESGNMSRLVVFESLMTVTGLNADDRIRIKPSQQLDVVLGLAFEISQKVGGASQVTEAYRDVPERIGVDRETWTKVVNALVENRGRSLVVAGGLQTQTQQGVELQMAVNLLNSILGNDGVTVDYDNAVLTGGGSGADLLQLIADMKAGRVKTLIIHNMNALYSLPTELGFFEGLQKVEMVLYTGNYADETGVVADYILPNGHFSETWADYELHQGVFTVQQPTIRPLYETRSFEESLFTWLKAAPKAPQRVAGAENWFQYLQNNWRNSILNQGAGNLAEQGFENRWVEVLQKGVYIVSEDRRNRTSSSRTASMAGFNPQRPSVEGLELALYQTVQLGDGTYANVAWLQELPDPVTKIVWDNYLMVSPTTARNLALAEGSMVTLSVGGRSVEVPVHIQPGVHDEVVALAVGYGRTRAGRVGNGIGVNAYPLSRFEGSRQISSGLAASIEKTGRRYELVTTQGHHQMEGRQIAVQATLGQFQKDPEHIIHRHKIFSAWPEHKYTKHKWAMAVDLNTCTGCSACVVACQAENNIPVVGKTYVMQGREMHWLRIDRYYTGTPENPLSVTQPMLCQHCENAPCETVCPVLATVHSDEGLNDMVYNRCVGTRYCSNNCPYKVRRFNWFNWAKQTEKPQHLAYNPDVTVRTRGVMEKCSFCVQRIREVANVARDEKRSLKDGELQTACQQSCPTDAIIFGDLNDPESRVRKLFELPRTYGVIEEFNTQPRVRYMAKIRNTEVLPGKAGHSGEQHGAEQKEGGHA